MDALVLVARVIELLRKENPSVMFLIITHYKRILEYIVPDHVHVLCDGKFVDIGDASLVRILDQKGYDAYKQTSS